jgi:2-keto-4-pentenoate hydratase/2-oxohepta-3-ene-1,7-dioic acid hydratase in catechol pathway
MRIGRFVVDGSGPRIGRFEGDDVVDVTDAVADFGDAIRRLGAGRLPAGGDTYDRAAVTHLPPTTAGNDVFAVALNYGSHIEEKSASDAIDDEARTVPESPFFFTKLNRSLVGHGAPISLHSDITAQFDFAAELAAVIGEPARNVDPDDAMAHVAGYTILNDTAAYDVQNVAVGDMTWIDWLSAKSMEDTTPLGPWVVGTDAVGDPHDLRIQSWVNGEAMQDGQSAAMLRGIAEQVAFLSSRFTLQPGDVIATGTPEGVGSFQDLALADGDRVEIEVADVGTLANVVREV